MKLEDMLVLPNCVLLDDLTSEDGLKHWYQQSQYIVIIALLNKINNYCITKQNKFIHTVYI
jgi:hypothetical protein